MAVSRLLPAGGANDFNLNLAGTYTSVTLNKEYASGSYSITSGNNDTTLDVYAFNADGTAAGYTNTKSFTASKGFNRLVVLGGQTGDVLGFTYKTTYTTVDASNETTAGPVATSINPTSAPKINDTFTFTGRNFATNCTVTFTSANTAYPATQAKNIVRSSATSLIVTRPDNLPPDYSPYTLTVQNPGVSNPIGSNAHILSNALTAGSSPVWVTGATLTNYTRNVAYSTTLQATDADAGSAITYSIVTGAFPSGLTLNGTTGVLSGTPTVLTNHTVTVRATDAGGNFVDRAFTINNVGANAPVWSTAAGALIGGTIGSAYSFQLVATDDSGATPTFAITVGSLPAGLSLNTSTGLISGTPTTNQTASFTVTATDANGSSTAQAFSITIAPIGATFYSTPGTYTFTVPTAVTSISVVAVGAGGGGGGYNSGNGGGGGGLGWKNNIAVSPGQTYTVVVGGGGSGGGASIDGSAGGTSYFSSTGVVAGFGGAGGQSGAVQQTNPAGGSYTGDGGGAGGGGGWDGNNYGGAGGGGAGGYSGTGGFGSTSTLALGSGNYYFPNTPSGGAGGGGGANGLSNCSAAGGGGVGMYGQGATGANGQGIANGQGGSALGFDQAYGGGGGSGGDTAINNPNSSNLAATAGGLRGGGGGGSNQNIAGGNGRHGGVRIIWGSGRSFPSTNVQQNYAGVSETVI